MGYDEDEDEDEAHYQRFFILPYATHLKNLWFYFTPV